MANAARNKDLKATSDSLDLSEILRTGLENSVTAKTICTWYGVSNRDLTKAIAAARKKGIPICASVGATPGYYLARNKQEMKDYCRSLSHRIAELEIILICCQAMAADCPE